MKKLKIAIDGNEANVRKRVGSGQYTFHILKYWAKTSQDDFHLYLKNPPLSDSPAGSPNWHYHVVGPQKAWLRFSLPLDLFFTKSKYDVFFSPAHYAPQFTGSKSVVTIHDLAYELFPELFLKRDLYKLKKWSRQSIEKATRVIAVSESTKHDIIKFYGTNPDKIFVVHNGYDQDHFHASMKTNSNVSKKYDLPRKNYLLYVGTIQPRKNLTRLVQAFHLLKNSGKYKGKLVVAGSPGWLADESLKAIKQSEYANDVIVTGYVDQSDLPTLYKNSDAYILPSLMEGFGIPLLEAMAVGTPVAAADNSSLPEVVGKAGELFDPLDPVAIADSIQLLLDNRKKYITKGFKQASKFSWEKTANLTLKILRGAALEK